MRHRALGMKIAADAFKLAARLEQETPGHYTRSDKMRRDCRIERRLPKMIRTALKSVVGIALVLVGTRACTTYVNWSAERNARALCDSIGIGSDIRSTISKFEQDTGFVKQPGGKESVRHSGYPDTGPYTEGHRFMFFGVWMDKAYCDISLTSDGRVRSKNAYLLEE